LAVVLGLFAVIAVFAAGAAGALLLGVFAVIAELAAGAAGALLLVLAVVADLLFLLFFVEVVVAEVLLLVVDAAGAEELLLVVAAELPVAEVSLACAFFFRDFFPVVVVVELLLVVEFELALWPDVLCACSVHGTVAPASKTANATGKIPRRGSSFICISPCLSVCPCFCAFSHSRTQSRICEGHPHPPAIWLSSPAA
jgi:hypothetical protein